MESSVYLDTRVRIVRKDTGVHLQAFGQTFTPREGSPSASELIRIKLNDEIDQIRREWTVPDRRIRLSETTSDKNTISFYVECLIDSEIAVRSNLKVQIRGNKTTIESAEPLVVDADGQSVRKMSIAERSKMARVLYSMIEQIPELSRAQIQKQQPGNAETYEAELVPARTLMQGDIVLMTDEDDEQFDVRVEEALMVTNGSAGLQMRIAFSGLESLMVRYLSLEREVPLVLSHREKVDAATRSLRLLNTVAPEHEVIR